MTSVSSCRRTNRAGHLVRPASAASVFDHQQAFWNFNWWQYWTAAGTPVERAANTNGHVMLKNSWWVTARHRGPARHQFCDRQLLAWGTGRAGDPYVAPWLEVDATDALRSSIHLVQLLAWRRRSVGTVQRQLQVTYRIASQVNTSLTLKATHNVTMCSP